MCGAQGWGRLYFSTEYTNEVVALRAEEARQSILLRVPDQVLVVPAEPLRLLASSPPLPIAGRTVVAANTALWRIEVFNQLVIEQTIFNAGILTELDDPSTPHARLEVIAKAAASMSETVHEAGIGRANATGGWYWELQSAVEANIDALEKQLSLGRRYRQEASFIVLDLAVGIFVVLVAIAAIVD
jgi:hypothetical protein